jgi:hypothetical protein
MWQECMGTERNKEQSNKKRIKELSLILGNNITKATKSLI